jgi:hypothetical protein
METDTQTKEQDEEVMHTMPGMETKTTSLFTLPIFILLLTIAVLGVGTGYVLARTNSGKVATNEAPTTKSSVESGKVYGSSDSKTFNNMAEGTLQEGGIDGEGQYHLVRPGGDSQNVYLTSSVVDLSLFVNKKVKVWGQTQTAQKAGWLMEVGRVQVE